MKDNLPKCAHCAIGRSEKACLTPTGKGPKFCPTLYNLQETEEGLTKYEAETLRFARQASIQESACYIERGETPHVLHPTKTRLEEICEFAQRMGYRRLGLAFCTGFHHEASFLTKVLEKHGFEVVSVVCKVGKVNKDTIGLNKTEQIDTNAEWETMCNPVTQAEILNAAATDFNILLGLCVGHDSLFFKHADAMTTVFAVKDRVLGHNPLAAVYTSEFYYQRLLKKPRTLDEKANK